MVTQKVREVILVLTTAMVICFDAVANDKPNVIYILADDLGYGDISSFNPHSKINTTHIDKLAQGGIKFTDMHTNSAVCTPTRYGILTGRYSWRTKMKKGVTNGHSDALIQSGRATIGGFMQGQGYHTAAIGKWHLGMNWQWQKGKKNTPDGLWVDFSKAIQQGPTERGFDKFYGLSASLNMAPHVYIDQNKVVGDLHFMADKKAIKEAGLVNAKPGWHDKNFIQSEVMGTLFDESINWITEVAAKQKPFFLYLPLNAPHTPIVPIQQFKGSSNLSLHGDFTLEMDHHVGRLMATLEKLNLTDNTLVIFTADNGVSPMSKLAPMQAKGHYSSGIYRGLKGSLYEGGHRVPFIAHWPKAIKPGQSSDYHISSTDFYATMADILNVTLGGNEAPDSKSFYPELLGANRQDTARGGVVYHSDAGFYAIRDGQWKLILHADAGTRRHNPKDTEIKNPGDIQLFDMAKDPGESINLAAQHPTQVRRLKTLLTGYIEQGRSTAGVSINNQRPDKNRPWVGLEKLDVEVTASYLKQGL